MEDSNQRWLFGIYAIQILTTAGAITGLLRDATQGKFTGWLIALLAVLVLTQVVLHFLARPRARYSLTERTSKFTKFFTNWYSRNGRHSIFCDDLEWLEATEHAPIVGAMMRRGRAIEVFVRDDTSPVCARLRGAGVAIYDIPVDTITRTSMSLHSLDGTQTLIIRAKNESRRDRNRISFIETRRKTYVSPVSDLFRVLRATQD